LKYFYQTPITTAAGFEPARPKDNALAGHRVNHSAKLSHETFSKGWGWGSKGEGEGKEKK
jgi:hypothetical protein